MVLAAYSYGRRSSALGFKATSKRISPIPLTFGHWPGVTPYTSSFELAESYVFVKQSLELFSCGPPIGGQALLRTYGRCFAEFLNEGSLVHLRLLASPTCVGFSTVTYKLALEVFLDNLSA